MRKTIAISSGALLFVVLTACSATPTAHQPAPTSPGDADNASLLWTAPEKLEAMGAAEAAGTLAQDAAGCWGLDIPDSPAGFYVAQFPYGTTLNSAGDGIVLSDGRDFLTGEFINGGGGYRSDLIPGDVPGFPENCSPEEVVFIGQIDD
ncbi:hypothetical protein [Pseudoclavibacter sp. Z016]|uniref:hypothetical protein n=1 Tax=Pseudoclavibacter sp. Z016 TaxID=2080581 RepID=UPI0011B06C4C|nr:hypothetical protein [Pseudoclavibacter sp. Z016]